MLTIGAIGSYATLPGGGPSFFAFAALHKELGGPAFFFVTGLCLGFGINRRLTLPPITKLHEFPLLRAAKDPDYLGKDLDLRKISNAISRYISPSEGDFWMAAGVKFTSFGMIESVAMLSVALGNRFEVALLGLASLQLPKPVEGVELKPLAVAELAIKVVFAPEDGVLSIEGRLTEASFVLRKDFTLRGGFAFYAWFAGPHPGDFVVSLGGYHPQFKPPAHYPRPELVAFNCVIKKIVSIEGHCYFALCPVAVMAGGGLSIVFQTVCIRAWLVAYADFLLQWKPLYYDVAMGVSVGVRLSLDVGVCRIALALELAAELALNGPPLAGQARIKLAVISFTIRFGEAGKAPPPLHWEATDDDNSFAKSFLTNPDVTRISIAAGLNTQIDTQEGPIRLVDPHRLRLICRNTVPANSVEFNGQELLTGTSVPALGVRPMDKRSMYSAIAVTLAPVGNASAAARLNTGQRELDRLKRRRDGLKSRLYLVWYQLNGGACGSRREQLSHQQLNDGIKALSNEISKLTAQIGQLESATGSDSLQGLQQRLQDLLAAFAVGLELEAGDGPRFRRPNDPVVLLAGAAVERSQRHGEDHRFRRDKRLWCRLSSQCVSSVRNPKTEQTFDPGQWLVGCMPKLPGDVPAEVKDLLGEALLIAGPDPDSAFDAKRLALIGASLGSESAAAFQQGLDLAWQAMDERNPVDTATNGQGVLQWTGRFPSPLLHKRWHANPWLPISLEWEVAWSPAPELAAWKLNEPPTTFAKPNTEQLQEEQIYNGSTQLTPAAVTTLADRLRAWNHSHDDALNKLEQAIRSMNLLSQTLSGFADQLLCRDPRLELPPLYADRSTGSIGSAAIAGLVNDIDWLRPLCGMPLLPLRAGRMALTRLRIIDAFGQSLDIPPKQFQANLKPALPPRLDAGNGRLWLEPRLSQAARLAIAAQDRRRSHRPLRAQGFGQGGGRRR